MIKILFDTMLHNLWKTQTWGIIKVTLAQDKQSNADIFLTSKRQAFVII